MTEPTKYLNFEDLDKLAELVIEMGLADDSKRKILILHLPKAYKAKLTHSNEGADQLTLDLASMNETIKFKEVDGSIVIPFKIWLTAVKKQARRTKHEPYFTDLINKLFPEQPKTQPSITVNHEDTEAPPQPEQLINSREIYLSLALSINREKAIADTAEYIFYDNSNMSHEDTIISNEIDNVENFRKKVLPKIQLYHGHSEAKLSEFILKRLPQGVMEKLETETSRLPRYRILNGANSSSPIDAKLVECRTENQLLYRLGTVVPLTSFRKDGFAGGLKAEKQTRLIVAYLKQENIETNPDLLKIWFRFWSNFPFEDSEFEKDGILYRSYIPILAVSYSGESKTLIQEIKSASEIAENDISLGPIQNSDFEKWYSSFENENRDQIEQLQFSNSGNTIQNSGPISLERSLAEIFGEKSPTMQAWYDHAKAIFAKFNLIRSQ